MIAHQTENLAPESDGLATIESMPPPDNGQTPEPFFSNPADWFVPRFPQKLEELDVSVGFLTELTLKMVSMDADCTTASVAAKLHLGMLITESLLQRLCRDKMIESKGVVGLHNHRYGILERGWAEVNRLTQVSSYAGPAPVSLKSYTERITQQVRSRAPVTPEALDNALNGLVVPDTAKQILGLVASSGRSLFLTGPSGNGKTAMARALVNAIASDLWIPYAIEVDSQIVRVYDSHSHQPVNHTNDDYDRRWIRIRAPLVMVGGELTIDSLDLTTNEAHRYYEAPVQVKANGGVLVIDDLGRQRLSATELLNRWIVPLEYRMDYLTLSTGKKFQVPFEQIIVFATNLTESDLADEAFLRRMGYRLHVVPPTDGTFTEIFVQYAQTRGLSVELRTVARLLERYRTEGRAPKCCDPRDLIERAVDLCRLRRETLNLSEEFLEVAWNGYFGVTPQTPGTN